METEIRFSKSLIHVFFFFFFFFALQFLALQAQSMDIGGGFAGTNGTHFVKNGRPIYLNGFNSYWMMYMATDPSSRDKVTSVFEQASNCRMNIVRTWAFSDGGNDRPLQMLPGVYNEDTFKGLDFVVSEAKKRGIYVVLSFVNNYKDYGGRAQYVQWGRERGLNLSSDDDFYTNPQVKQFYKNHVTAVVTRNNSITGVAYKDDPTIFAWELMNEPRSNDVSGTQIQDWVAEMARHVKSIDANHLLEIGLEGFYGQSKRGSNPSNFLVGTDFIANNQVPDVDFATIHLYPDEWLESSNASVRDAFVDNWIQTHIQDSDSVLRKPLVIGEFGKSSKKPGYTLEARNRYLEKIYDDIFTSAKAGGPFSGGLFWQVMAVGMDSWADGYEVVLEESPSTAGVIAQQSRKLSTVE